MHKKQKFNACGRNNEQNIAEKNNGIFQFKSYSLKINELTQSSEAGVYFF